MVGIFDAEFCWALLKCAFPLVEEAAVFLALRWLHVPRGPGGGIILYNGFVLWFYFQWAWRRADAGWVELEKKSKRQSLEWEEERVLKGRQ